MSYKDLNIDWDRVSSVLRECAGGEVVGPIEKGAGAMVTHEYVIKVDGKEAKIHFFLKKGGTVTVHYKVGKNQDISEQIASKFIELAVTDRRKSVNVSVKQVDLANYDLLREFLVDEIGGEIVEEKEENGYKFIAITSPYRDKLTYKFYDNGTLQVQGKPLYLWGQTLMFFAEFLSLEDVVKHQTSIYKVDICPDQVRDELEALMPNAHGYISETHKKILASALSLNKIDLELEDYSPFAFPALRGVEGYVKQLLKDKGIIVGRDGFKGLFRMNATQSAYLLNDDHRDNIGCGKTCQAVQDCYSFYNSHRHSLFHMEGDTETTRVIEIREEARELVMRSIAVIETSHGNVVN